MRYAGSLISKNDRPTKSLTWKNATNSAMGAVFPLVTPIPVDSNLVSQLTFPSSALVTTYENSCPAWFRVIQAEHTTAGYRLYPSPAVFVWLSVECDIISLRYLGLELDRISI